MESVALRVQKTDGWTRIGSKPDAKKPIDVVVRAFEGPVLVATGTDEKEPDREPVLVNDHDFRSDAHAIAVPYGIYDLHANAGTVFVGTSYDTPGFAVDCVEKWWRTEGRRRYPKAKRLTILADGGGSNGSTCRAWKFGLHHRLCDRHGLTVTVAHYPPGASKWNPIEHRLFSELSKNWA